MSPFSCLYSVFTHMKAVIRGEEYIRVIEPACGSEYFDNSFQHIIYGKHCLETFAVALIDLGYLLLLQWRKRAYILWLITDVLLIERWRARRCLNVCECIDVTRRRYS